LCYARAAEHAKLGSSEALGAIRRLDAQARALEARAMGPYFETFIAAQREHSARWGGKAVH
jgi:hypothetical protein